MIAKGNQRSGGQQLATHLLNAHDNERVEVVEISGTIARDLHGAFKEWRATSDGTQCKKHIYSLSINPNPADGILTREQYFDFIARMEEKQGLTGQPRAVVFHVKDGREHCHVAWSRIDLEHMKAIHMAHDRQKIRAVVQEFALEHGLTLPRGMKNNRGLGRFNDHAKGVSLAEKQQEERTGLTKEERRKEMTEAWRHSDTGQAFVRALEAKGYALAQGERRAYVVVDRFGEIHALARQIEGVKTKEVKARLAAFPLEKLPEAAKVQEQTRARARTKSKIQITATFKEHAASKWDALKHKQQIRREALNSKRKALVERHQKERKALLDTQKKENTARAEKRNQTKTKGLKAFLGKVTGISALLRKKHQQQDQAKTKKQAQAFKTLKTRQNRQVQDINRRFRALGSLERRESRSLKTALQRRQYKHLNREFRQAVSVREPEKPKRPSQEFSRQTLGKAKAPPMPQKRPSSRQGKPEEIRDANQEVTKPQAPKQTKEDDALAAAFRRAEKQKAKREQEKDRTRDDPGRTMSR